MRKPRKTADPLALTAEYRPGWIEASDKRRADYKAVMAAREALINDLGGIEALSVQRLMILDRVIFVCLRLTTLERMVLAGEEIDWSNYGFMTNVLTGHLKTLGLDRRIKNLGSLQEYLEAAE